MGALALLEQKVVLLLKRTQALVAENEEYKRGAIQLEQKLSALQETLLNKESLQSLPVDNTQADSIIHGLIQRIDLLLESPR